MASRSTEREQRAQRRNQRTPGGSPASDADLSEDSQRSAEAAASLLPTSTLSYPPPPPFHSLAQVHSRPFTIGRSSQDAILKATGAMAQAAIPVWETNNKITGESGTSRHHCQPQRQIHPISWQYGLSRCPSPSIIALCLPPKYSTPAE